MGQGINKVLLGAGSLIFALFVVVSALADGGNSISKLAVYLFPILIIGSFVNGQFGMVVLLFGFAYSDLLKRCLVIFGRFSFQDIANVLMLVPLCTLAVFAHFFIKRFLTGYGKSKKNDLLLFVGIASSALIALSLALRFGLGLGVVKEIAQNAPYGLLIWVAQMAFPDKASLKKFMGLALLVFVPVALYGIKQHFTGFTDFELDYLLSGFTTESKHLNEEEIHAFSTMGSSVPFGNVMAICVGYVIFYMNCSEQEQAKQSSFLPWLLLISVFLLACYSSSKRSTWIVGFSIVVMLFAFRKRGTTAFVYSSGAALFVSLILFVEPLLKNWAFISGKITDITGLQLATYSSRLVGVYNWSRNPEMWTLFGVASERRDTADSVALGTGLSLDKLSSLLAHDMIGFTLLNYGALALIVMMVGGMVVVKRLHRTIFLAPLGMERNSMAAMAAVLLGCVFSGMSNAIIFPVNAFGLLSLGVFFRYQSFLELSAASSSESEVEQPAALLEVSKLGSVSQT